MRIKALIASLLLLVGVGGYFLATTKPEQVVSFELGGAFTLTNHKGEAVSEAVLKNRPHVIFFGFTHCPDVCPTSLHDMTQALEKLGGNASKLDIYFITVDVERDTQELLAKYLSSFHPRLSALTGTRAEMDKVIKSYRVFAKKQGEGESYTYDHSSSFFLFDKQKQFVGTIAYNEKLETIVEKLQLLIKR
jgi:protein SCO1